MKKIKILIMFSIMFLMLFIANNVYASDEETKLLYQDITINTDGSITVKEAAWLDGEYNGRWRDIEFKNTSATTFTGIYSNFVGNTDIYNGSGIKDIKVYDISQSNFNSIDDIANAETTYEKVESASNGKYGVYELEESSYGAEFKIYCPSKQNKVLCIEYTITDAVVVHNDVAELYWNVLGEYFEENVRDFQVKIHLPGEDSDVRIWTHGPLTGENEIIDSKTLYFKDQNVDSYTAETVRVMFNKDIVPEATKKSNVDGREYILKYEAAMADTANAEREKEKLELENSINQAVLDLEKRNEIYYYNRALRLVNELDDENENKQGYLNRIEATKEAVNEDWKEEMEYSISWLVEDNYRFLNERRLEDFKEEIEAGFDEEAKAKYLNIYNQLEEIVELKQANTRKIFTTVVVMLYVIFGIIVLYKIVKIVKERHTFKGKYYRDFPSNDEPNVIEYLMKRKSTNLGFSATILNLIAKKVITYEKVPDDKEKDITLVLTNENYTGSKAEIIVLNVLFNMVSKGNRCSINSLKKYGSTETKARKLLSEIKKFKKETKKEVEAKEYFKQNATSIIIKIFIIINYVFSLFMAFGVFYGLENIGLEVLWYILGVTIVSGIYICIACKDKNRTIKGMEEYSKWLAHKRFLENFSNFDEKDLPEITLWEKYLVTATVLGCADKVQKQMKMYITTNTNQIDTNLLIYSSINFGLTRELNRSVKSAISHSSSTINATSSSYSSGGGFGGGSSGGGGFRWPEVAAEVVSSISPS